MTHTLTKLPKNTFEATITIPWTTIQKEYEVAFVKLQENLQVEGYRKGKAPKKIAEKHIQKDKIYEEAIQVLIPRLYQDILKTEDLKPITQPKVELVKAKENEDWEIKITFATKPDIKLGDYKNKIKSTSKKAEIWVPGQDKTKKELTQEEKKQKQLNDALTVVLQEVVCEVPDMLINSELEHRLSQIVDDVQKIGLTMDAYLKSKGLTMEEIKKRFLREIQEMYKLEFVLMEIADQEKIEVKKEDLDKLFSTLPSEEEKKKAQENSYYYASLIRKQKTLDFLTNL